MVVATTTGRETLASIEKALADVSERADKLQSELDKANQSKAELIARRLDAFGDLAKFRTQLALADGVIDEADQLSTHVRTILEARQTSLDALKRREADAGDERAERLKAQEALDKEIEALETKLDGFAKTAKRKLASDAKYSALTKRQSELEDMAAKAAAKAETAHAEEAEKGAPYRDDPLFMYLWDRGYSTPRYDKTGLVRALDGWVAKLVGYQDARSNFAVLTQIPQRLSAHAERLAEEMKAGRDTIDKIEAEKIKDLAGDDFLKSLHASHEKRMDKIADIERLNAELLETGSQIKAYAEGNDPSFAEAIAKTTQFLEGQSLTALRHEARATTDSGDDEIVALIARLTDERNSLDNLMRSKGEALNAAFKRKEELLRIAAEFRRSRYDRPGSVFEPGTNGGGEALLQMLLEGAITAVEYWARTQSRQRWKNRPADSYRHSGNFPSSRRSSRRSSSDGPEFRTGGGF